MFKELIEKQKFIINLENIDIADVMHEQEEQDEDYDDMHLGELLEHEKLDLIKLEGSRAIINYKNKKLSIKLEQNNTEYKLSMLEFLDYPTYKKITGYFLEPVHVTITNVSKQIGGIIDKNYGFKVMVSI